MAFYYHFFTHLLCALYKASLSVLKSTYKCNVLLDLDFKNSQIKELFHILS